MPSNEMAIVLLNKVAALKSDLEVAEEQLRIIQRACDHQYDTPRGIWGDHCRKCGHWSGENYRGRVVGI